MTTQGPPGLGLADGDGIAAEELHAARFILALAALGIGPGEVGERWVALAMRGRRFRQQMDAAAHRRRDDMLELAVVALPGAWRLAFLWGYHWPEEPPQAGAVHPALAELRAKGWPQR